MSRYGSGKGGFGEPVIEQTTGAPQIGIVDGGAGAAEARAVWEDNPLCSEEQLQVLQQCRERKNIFFTGSAGTLKLPVRAPGASSTWRRLASDRAELTSLRLQESESPSSFTSEFFSAPINLALLECSSSLPLAGSLVCSSSRGDLIKFALPPLRSPGKERQLITYFLQVTATTGIAALQINGSTLHSWAGVGLGKDPVLTLSERILYVVALARFYLQC